MKIQIFSTSEPFILLRMRNRAFANSWCRRCCRCRWCWCCFVRVQHLSASRWFPISLIHFQPTLTHFGCCTLFSLSVALPFFPFIAMYFVYTRAFLFSVWEIVRIVRRRTGEYALMMQQQLSFMMTAKLSSRSLNEFFFSALKMKKESPQSFTHPRLANTNVCISHPIHWNWYLNRHGAPRNYEKPLANSKLCTAYNDSNNITLNHSRRVSVNVFGSISVESKWRVIAVFL